jgi:hypothetical protein
MQRLQNVARALQRRPGQIVRAHGLSTRSAEMYCVAKEHVHGQPQPSNRSSPVINITVHQGEQLSDYATSEGNQNKTAEDFTLPGARPACWQTCQRGTKFDARLKKLMIESAPEECASLTSRAPVATLGTVNLTDCCSRLRIYPTWNRPTWMAEAACRDRLAV